MSFSANNQNFDDWCCIFNSSLEPGGEYTQLLPDLIKLTSLFYKNQIQTILNQENSKKLSSLIIPNAIISFLNFSSNIKFNEVQEITHFLKKSAKFAFLAIKTNQKPIFPSLIKLFDKLCIFYQKNDLTNSIYDQIAQKFIDCVIKNKDAVESLEDFEKNENQDLLESFHALFFISHHLSQTPKYKKFAQNLIDQMLRYFYVFLDNIKNFRELNTISLKEIFTVFFDDMKDIITQYCAFKLLNFFIKCLKSDYLDKQLFAAHQIVDICSKPKLFEHLLNFNSKEVNIIDLIISNNFHFEVLSILNTFLTQMASQKMLTIHHLIQFWEKFQNLHITEKKSAIELISNCLDFFDETELQTFIEYLNTKKSESSDIFSLLAHAVISIQHKDNMKQLSYDIINNLLNDISLTEAQKGISEICSKPISTEISKIIANKVIFNICNNDLIDFTLNITLTLIKKLGVNSEIFNDSYVNNLISLIFFNDETKFDNRKHIFMILHNLYKTTSMQPNSDIFKELIQFKTDDILWDFFRKLLLTNGLIEKEQAAPIEEAVKNQNLQKATINFANFIIAFVFFMNRSKFLNVKFNEVDDKDDIIKSSSIQSFHLETIDLDYFDLLLDLYLESDDDQVSNNIKDFILKIYTSCTRLSCSTKDIQQRVSKQINDNDELKKTRILTLIYEFIQTSEIDMNPEDFGLPRHKISKKFIEIIINDNDNKKVHIHVNPKSTVLGLKSRISVLAKTKVENISIQKLDFEKDDKLIENLNLKPQAEFKWSLKPQMRIRQISEPPPSCELHKNHFSDCLLELLDKECSEETSKIVWKLLKFLPTNENTISTLDDFDLFFSTLNQSKNSMKFRYYLQAFHRKYSPEFINQQRRDKDDDENDSLELKNKKEYLSNFVNLFKDKKYPKKELLHIFISLFEPHDLFQHAELIVPELLWCISRDANLAPLVNNIFTKLLLTNPTGTSDVLMKNLAILTETIHTLNEKDWPIFINLLSNSLNLNEVTDMCIDELSNEGQNLRFFLQLQTKIVHKLKIKVQIKEKDDDKEEEEEEEEDNFLKQQKIINIFNICIDFFNTDKYINDVLNLLCVLIQDYPQLLQMSSKSTDENYIKKIPIDKIISIAFDDPPEQFQKIIFKILIEIINNAQNNTENDDLILIRDKINQIISIKVERWNYNPAFFRKTEIYVGLRNLGATCFVNSVIQQIFHLYPARYLLLMHRFEATDEYINLQYLFQQMMFTERSFCDPSIFIGNWHGWHNQLINTREQQDSFEFLSLLIDDNVKNEYHCPTEINVLFKGEMNDRLEGVNEPLSSKTVGIFDILPLSIKGFKNISESFKEFKQTETIEDYACENPNRKIAVRKFVRISKPPNILVIQLKRFEYDLKTYQREKINDRFEFPNILDISEICDFEDDSTEISHNDCLFDLHGVIIHTGNANGGHYISIVDIDNQWYLFNDIEVSKIDNETMEKICYGDNTEQKSAYLLFYVKKDYKQSFSFDGYNESFELTFNENAELDEIIKQEKFSDEIKKDNLLFKQTQSLFNPTVIDFIMNFNDFEINLKYFINILCHSAHKEKSSQFQKNIIRIIDDQHKEIEFINYLISHFDDVFNNYLNCSEMDIMKDFNKVIIYCIRKIKNDEIQIKNDDIDPSQIRLLPFILCNKIYENVLNHMNAFRQMPLILSIVEYCISTYPDIAYENEYGFNWFEKIIQLVNGFYSIQRSSQFSAWDYSSLFRSLISIIKIIPKHSVDCSFLLAHSQNILKSEYNAKDYIELLFLCSKNQNIDINNVFDLLSSLNNSPKIVCKYFTDLICTSKSYEPILANIYKFINSEEQNNDVIYIPNGDFDQTLSKKKRCFQIIEYFEKAIEENNSIFISNFIKFSPFIVHDLITSNDESVRLKCEGLYYKVFRSYSKMPLDLTYRGSNSELNASSSYIRNSNNIQMGQFLHNIEDYLLKIEDIKPYYPTNVKTRIHSCQNDQSYSDGSDTIDDSNDSDDELFFKITVSPADEHGFRLLSILKLYRWIVYSMHNEYKNHLMYSSESDPFNQNRIEFIFNLIQIFTQINIHPDYHTRQLVLLLGEFPVDLLQNNLYRVFKIIFFKYDHSSYSSHNIQVELEPIIHIINYYKDEEDLYDDILSIFMDNTFCKSILRIFMKSSNPLLNEIIPLLKEFKMKCPNIISNNDYLLKALTYSPSSHNSNSNFTSHYSMSKSGSLLQQEVNRSANRNSNFVLNEVPPNPTVSEIYKFLNKAIEILMNEIITNSIKEKIDKFIDTVKPNEDLNDDLINLTDKDITDALKKSPKMIENLGYLFKLAKWCTHYSLKTQNTMKKLILDIFNCKDNVDELIIETAKFAIDFDFEIKKESLLFQHCQRLKMNHSPNIKSFGAQRNKKMMAFYEEITSEVSKTSKGEIEWMKFFAEHLIKDDGQSPQEKELRLNLISKLSDETLLQIFQNLENDFRDSDTIDKKKATLKPMNYIANMSSDHLLSEMKAKATLTESDFRLLKPILSKNLIFVYKLLDTNESKGK